MHPGATREPPPPNQIHDTIYVYPFHCPEFATALSADLPDVLPVVTTYVWEIPPVVPQVTAYVHHTVGRPTCQTSVRTDQRTTGAPQPGASGARATALVVHHSVRDRSGGVR